MLCNDNCGSTNCAWIIIIAAIVVVWLLCGNNCGNNCGC